MSQASIPLHPCPACSQQVSSNAVSCPKCGQPLKSLDEPKRGRLGLQIIGASLIFLGFAYINAVSNIHGSFIGGNPIGMYGLLAILWGGGLSLFIAGAMRR